MNCQSAISPRSGFSLPVGRISPGFGVAVSAPTAYNGGIDYAEDEIYTAFSVTYMVAKHYMNGDLVHTKTIYS